MKLCKDCIFFEPGRFGRDYCKGPHIYHNVVTGKPLMELPGARYSGGQGLLPGAEPCGEKEAHHWTPRQKTPKSLGRFQRFLHWTRLGCICPAEPEWVDGEPVWRCHVCRREILPGE